MLLPLTAMAQTPTFESLFKEYSTKENCTTINISNTMLRSMEVNIDAEYMQVIAIENESLNSTFQAQADKVLSGLEVVMSVSSGGKSVKICQRSNENNEVVEIYIMACSSDECILMHIVGKNLELNNIGSLMNMV
jgi:hypothetical protein